MDILKRNWKSIDIFMVLALMALTAYSCLLIYAATYGKTDTQMPTHAWIKQLVFSAIGFVAMWFAAAFDYRSLRKIHWWLYGCCTVLLTGVYAFRPINGARSWIPLPGFNIQPSELIKLAMIITFAALMAKVDDSEFPDYRFIKTWPMWLVVVVPFALTWKEPALGQALVMIAIFCTLYVLFMRRSWFLVGVTAFVGFSLAFIAVPAMFPTQVTNFVQNVLIKHNVLHGYQGDRILSWLDPKYKLSGAGFEIAHVQTAIGSGQIFGEGWLKGLETNAGFVPNQWNDYIFSAVGEEFGFVGSSLLVILFLVLMYRLVRVASLSQDTFGSYIVMGVFAMFGFQVFENIAMDMYMSPSTGITLPFISYGGSSLVVNYLCVGIVLSVLLRQKPMRFSQ